MNTSQVIETYELLLNSNIDTWIQGGWGTGTLLNRQTREHHDLDLLARVVDAVSSVH